MDSEGRIFESNFAFREMLGPGGEIEQEWRSLQADLARRGEEFGQAEKRYLRRDGQTAWVRLNISLMGDGQDAPAFSVNFLENISRHRRAEEALKQSRERFRLLYDKAPLGYQSLDEGGHVFEVNQTWLDILGYAREEVIARWFGNFLPPTSQTEFESIFATLKAQGEIDLKGVIQENIEDRKREAVIGERIVDEADVHFQQWYKSLYVVPTIVALRKKIDDIVKAESNKLLQTLAHPSEEDRQAVDRMTNAIVKKILHDPTLFLKSNDADENKSMAIDIARKIFNIEN